jgi:hypothetical protein
MFNPLFFNGLNALWGDSFITSNFKVQISSKTVVK